MNWTPEQWQRLEPHLDAMLDLDPVDRPGYLAALPETDRELRADLGRLLAQAEAESPASLAARAPDLLGAIGSEWIGPDPLLHRTLGPYRLEEKIGAGGMGVVYRAERNDDAYRHAVAVKILHGTAGPESARRFQRERETLARLDHPNITRILDGGVSGDGLSYLVMELVRGEPITVFCSSRGWDLRRRVALFLDVCEAVQAAHQQLIVHRDLKPSNVLVTADSTVKVLDFGIAKWLDEERLPGAALATRTGDRFLTVQYASPEQFRGGPITTASDVYALGVLLYEILAGTPPYVLEGKPPKEQERTVCEAPVPALTCSLAGSEAREVRGDLDRVVQKALRKEPGRRYPTAEALAGDLRAWLEGRPVTATPDSRAYRIRRFISRNRIGVAAGTAVAFALLAGLVGTAWQGARASRERDRARLEARHAQEVVDFLVGALEKANPFESPEEVTVGQLVDRSLDRVERDIRNQPELRLKLYLTMGQVIAHTKPGLEALPVLDRALGLADSIYGPGSLPAAKALHLESRVLASRGRPDSARVSARQAESYLRGRAEPEAELALAAVLEDLSGDFRRQAHFDSALVLDRESLAIRERLLPVPHQDLARSYHSLATSLSGMRDPDAPHWFARAAAMWRAAVGDPHLNLAITLNNWAVWHHHQGVADSAEALYRESLAMSEAILGESSVSIVNPIINLGNFYIEQERYDAAEPMIERGLGILAPQRGDVIETGAAYANLGHARFFQAEYADAERAYLEARRIFVGVFGPEHVNAGVMDSYLGRLYWKWERSAAAKARFEAALERFQDIPAVAAREASARVWYGRLCMEQGDLEAAEVQLRAGYRFACESFSEQRWERAEAAVALGSCLVRQGAREEGLPLLRVGLDALVASRGPDHPMTRWAAAERSQVDPGT